MVEVIEFKVTAEEYCNLAREAYFKGDAAKAISFLHKAQKEEPSSAAVALQLSSIYEDMDEFELANDALFRALAHHPSEQDEDEINERLGSNLAQMGMGEAAAYYLGDDIVFDDDFVDLELAGAIDPEQDRLRVVYPKGEDYFEMLIEKARELVQKHKYDEAIMLMDKVDASSSSRALADHVVLVSLMMKNDLDGVIENAKRMLNGGANKVIVMSTVAAAYLLEGRNEEGYAVMKELVKTDFNEPTDVLLLLPNLINFKMHDEVLKYTSKILGLTAQSHCDGMIWHSQALYNLGRREEAVKEMAQVNEIYGRLTPAKYYLSLYAQQPESVEYSLNIPYAERLQRYQALKEFTELAPSVASQMLDGSTSASEVRDLIEWAFDEDSEELKMILTDKLASVRSKWVTEFYKNALVYRAMSFELTAQLLLYIVKEGGFTLDFDIVTRERFKTIHATLPTAFFKLPIALDEAVGYCMAEIIYTDDDPNLYLARLTKIVNDIVTLDENGKLKYMTSGGAKAAKLKSIRTIIGVILSHVYSDEESAEDTIERYGLNKRTFEKYDKIIFGE